LCRAGVLALLVSLVLPAAADEAGHHPDAAAAPAQLSRREAQLLIGRPVENPQRARIGTADDLLLDSHGEIRAVVIELGGFLGIGERKVAIGRDAFRVAPDGQSIVVTMTADQLARAPSYREDKGQPVVGTNRAAGVR
jgi:hypothetical protein